MKTLNGICEAVHQARGRMIFIGEKNDRNDFMQDIQLISDYTWIDRPVNMDALVKAVDRELSDQIQGRKHEAAAKAVK